MAQAQTVKIIDVARSYVPIDPNSFPDNLQSDASQRQDADIPVMAYDGQNFLPTAYGYKSYFGIDTTHPADPLIANVDAILVFQNNSLNNILVALTASGIWMKYGASTGAWVQEVMLEDKTDELIHYPWTWCIQNDNLYCYRSNGDHFWEIKSKVAAPGYEVVEKTPTFLNMAAQVGIFRAGNRLGFWDTANSVAWSSLDDLAEFTPNLETLAGSSVFSAVIGRIINIKTHGDGFIIYATKSIVYVEKSESALFLWTPQRLLEGTGIAYMHEVVEGIPNTVHYVYTTTGVYEIKNASPTLIIPEITDYFKLYKGPKYLKLLEGRYLVFEVIDPSFITAFPPQVDYPIPPLDFEITAESLEELYQQAYGESPSIRSDQFFAALASGFLNQPNLSEGGAG